MALGFVGLRLDPTLHAQVKLIAQRNDLTESELVRIFIREGMKKIPSSSTTSSGEKETKETKSESVGEDHA